jgi:hypothetical protein
MDRPLAKRENQKQNKVSQWHQSYQPHGPMITGLRKYLTIDQYRYGRSNQANKHTDSNETQANFRT